MSEDAFLTEHDAPLPARIKGLIFDCDGTLVDTMPLHFQAWSTALANHGLNMSEERFYSFAGMPTRTIVELLSKEQGVTVDAESVAHEKEEMYIASIADLQRIKQVVDIALREKGKRKLAVASGGWQRVVRKSLRAIGMEQEFEVIVGADDVVHGKPAPDMFLKAAELMGLQPEECVVYEDGDLGIEGAKRAGMAWVDVRPWYLPRKTS